MKQFQNLCISPEQTAAVTPRYHDFGRPFLKLEQPIVVLRTNRIVEIGKPIR